MEDPLSQRRTDELVERDPFSDISHRAEAANNVKSNNNLRRQASSNVLKKSRAPADLPRQPSLHQAAASAGMRTKRLTQEDSTMNLDRKGSRDISRPNTYGNNYTEFLQQYRNKIIRNLDSKQARRSTQSAVDLETEFAGMSLTAVRSPEREVKKEKESVVSPGGSRALLQFAPDIYEHRRLVEQQFLITTNYMQMQTDINSKMREILVNWLVEVHIKFKLQQETLYVAVKILDRFLTKRSVSRNKLQLVGCASMFIAAKYEEICPPELREFVYVCDGAFTKDQVLEMEEYVVNTLMFQFTCPTPLYFLDTFLHNYENDCSRVRNLAYFFLELTLQDFQFVRCLPSTCAAAALYLAIAVTNNGNQAPEQEWHEHLATGTHYPLFTIASTVEALYGTICRGTASKYRAVRKKFAHSRFGRVSLLDVTLAADHIPTVE
jgi:cyclin B